MTRRRRTTVALAGASLLALAVGLVPANAAAPPKLSERERRASTVVKPAPAPRADVPADRYDLAGGCYALGTGGRWVVRTADGFAATAPTPQAAEPFHLQATDLGSYLLHGRAADFLAASGARVVAATTPSPDADFVLQGTGRAATLVLADGRALAAAPGGALGTAAAPGRFAFRRTTGCAVFPEVEVGVTGPVVGGSTPYTETAGYLDAHLHTMAFEFVGGNARCGRPWHRYGVTFALVDCPDHALGGRGAVLETVLSGTDPVAGHDTVGWPSFGYWPKYDSLTHEQVYYKWLERAHRSGLRMMTTLLVENGFLCKAYPLKGNSCNEMDSVRLQAQRLREFERYIDAQSGGPGEGWFRIVTDPAQARRTINEGRLAVVMGIEISQLFDCTTVLGAVDGCDAASIERQLDEVFALGVRQMQLSNKFDNALSGVTGDAGQTGVVVNQGNKGETGSYWRMATCLRAPDEHAAGAHDGHDHGEDREQTSVATGTMAGQRDSIFAGVLQVTGTTGVAPVYPAGPHCNTVGLSELGELVLAGMVERGMMFDPDHMSAAGRQAAMDVMQAAGHAGIVSSHTWSDSTIYPRVIAQGGIVTPYAGDSTGFVTRWRETASYAEDTDQYWGIGYGADTNGFGSQGAPRRPSKDPVTYPFTGFGGVRVARQVSGERTYDVNVDGVAHYGLYADWVEDLRRLAGDAIVRDLERGPESYLQSWERGLGVPGRRCHPVAELTGGTGLGALRTGMTPEQVLATAGQPHVRDGRTFTYCVEGGRTSVQSFDAGARLVRTAAGGPSAVAPEGVVPPPAAAPGRGTLPTTGGAPLAVPAVLALALLALLTRLAAVRRRGA